MNIVFLDAKSIADEMHWPDFGFEHQFQAYPNTSPSEVTQRLQGVDILISNKVPVSAAELQHADRLRHIAVPATGFNHIDLAACAERGITVSHIKDYAEVTVSEHCLALLFALKRSLLPYHESVRAGRWQEVGQFSYFDFPIMQVQGSTLGIIGAGRLGRAFARRAELLGMKVLFAERKGRSDTRAGYLPFDQVLALSDVLSLHCPLMPATEHLLDAEAFAKMQRQPLIINTSRGALIDAQALVEALHTGQICAAGIDVVDEEPPAADHPYMSLLELPNFILTPHVAWANRTAMQHLVNELVENIQAFVAGRPRNLIT